MVEFDLVKIENAISKAMNAVGDKEFQVAKKLALAVEEEINSTFIDKTPTVEEIQDIVEKILMKKGYEDAAKAYILYRDKRSKVRELNTSLMKTFDKINNSDAKDSDLIPNSSFPIPHSLLLAHRLYNIWWRLKRTSKVSKINK